MDVIKTTAKLCEQAIGSRGKFRGASRHESNECALGEGLFRECEADTARSACDEGMLSSERFDERPSGSECGNGGNAEHGNENHHGGEEAKEHGGRNHGSLMSRETRKSRAAEFDIRGVVVP